MNQEELLELRLDVKYLIDKMNAKEQLGRVYRYCMLIMQETESAE